LVSAAFTYYSEPSVADEIIVINAGVFFQNYYFYLKNYVMTRLKPILIILVVLNIVVLLGQLWPEGAPPFARVVNILFLSFSLLFFYISLRQKAANSHR
jgi:hypothetical protein